MKSYDDLQRFKEKTQTNHIEFKDMSGQTKHSDSASWAIIQQLMDKGTDGGLGNGQRVEVNAPQPIKEAIFSAPAAQPAPLQAKQQTTVQPASAPVNQPTSSVQSHGVNAFISAKSAAQPAGSLLETISASLKPAQVQAVEASAENPAAPQPALFAAVTPPAAAPSADRSRFKQLFSPVPESPQTLLLKETLLQPLLERIARCR